MKKTKKLDPKIIRRGDVVRIKNPEMFIRCGYPLSFPDVCEEVSEIHKEDILKFIDKVTDIKPKLEIRVTDPTNNRIYQAIVKELAYIRMREKKFGGSERRIFTLRNEAFKNARAEVFGVKIVKTGDYVKGSRGYDPYSGEYDYEPSYLGNEKTHKILQLYIRTPIIQRQPKLVSAPDWNYDIAIEVIHVEKIMDKAEFEARCGIIDYEEPEV